jgi:hypothetical protein
MPFKAHICSQLIEFIPSAEDGWYMNMINTDCRPGFAARLESRYMNTTNMCAELFYKTNSSSKFDVSTVSIITVSEDKFEITLAVNSGDEPPMWNRLFAVLPQGINQVVIEGRRSSSGFSSLFIDDVAILPCSTFGNALWTVRVCVDAVTVAV